MDRSGSSVKTGESIEKGARGRMAGLAQVSRGARAAAENVVTDLESLDVRTPESSVATIDARARDYKSKMQAAREFGETMDRELKEMASGLEARLQEIGQSVIDATNFKGGREKILSFFGRLGVKSALDAAQKRRLIRLDQQEVDEVVAQIAQFVVGTIQELGEIEHQYASDKQSYDELIKTVIKKLEETQPRYAEARAEKERLETELKNLTMELEAGTIDEKSRPAAERKKDDLDLEFHEALLAETEFLEIVRRAQEAVPELQKSRDSAQKSIVALRQMRRGLLEKQENFALVLKNAMTAVRAQARLERFESVDPVYNRTITLITEHNVKVAGAAMSLAIERAQHAAIDPDKSIQLAIELLGHINDFCEGIIALEDDAKKGARRPVADHRTTNDAS